MRSIENSGGATESVPQRLKPEFKCGIYGTAEAVPLSRTKRFLAIQTVFALVAMAALSRSASAQVDVSEWPRVQVEVLALNDLGEPMAGLTKDALLVKEGKQTHGVVDVQPAAEPQSVCVLVDASGLMYDRLATVLTKAKRLVKSLPAEDEVCLADFANDLFLDQKLTQDHRTLDAGLAQVKASGGAAERDALLELARYMRGAAKYRSRAIILFSDGTDNKSKATWEQARQGLEAEGSPVVHMICVPPAFGNAARKQVDPERKSALKITKPSGGITYFPHNMGDLNSIVDNFGPMLKSRYVVTFEAADSTKDGQEQEMLVSFDKTHRTGKAEVLAPEGYYAPSH